MILEHLINEDDGLFSVPVDREEYPEYFEVIENPMDFGTIQKKLDDGDINPEDAYRLIDLVFDNALTYNHSQDNWVNIEARRIQTIYQDLVEESSDTVTSAFPEQNEAQQEAYKASLTFWLELAFSLFGMGLFYIPGGYFESIGMFVIENLPMLGDLAHSQIYYHLGRKKVGHAYSGRRRFSFYDFIDIVITVFDLDKMKEDVNNLVVAKALGVLPNANSTFQVGSSSSSRDDYPTGVEHGG